MTIQQQPASLSLLGNMQELVIGSIADVTMTLCLQGSEENLVEHTYSPDKGGTIRVDLRDVVEAQLSFLLQNTQTAYQQYNIVRAFTGTLVSGEQTETFSFTVIRAGVDQLADSAENFLAQNFLTWQPTVKPVTYYTPEFLTYYAQQQCTVKGMAYDSQGHGTAITIAALSSGACYTIPTGYAVIAGIAGSLPSYYDVWVEDANGTRLTYIQRYYASDIKSEEEQWILFENSLGGIDTFRAYGDSENIAQHEHKIAEIEEENVEYRVDTERKHKKSTGLLDKHERRWLLDFFPSKVKYIYTESSIRRIVVTESDVNYTAKELPSEYNFTYKFADDKPYLNIPRTDASLAEMHIDVPDIGSFTIAPRLVEFPRQTLSGGALIPTQDPYSENWGVTTMAAIAAFLLGDTTFTEGLPQNGLSENDVLAIVRAYCGDKYLSKTNPDTAQEVITLAKGLIADAMSVFMQGLTAKEMSVFEKGLTAKALSVFQAALQSADYEPGLATGRGWGISERGVAEFAGIRARFMEVLELIINRLSAIEGDQILTEADTIESVEIVGQTAGGKDIYRLHLKDKWDNYVTAQYELNILQGIVNTLPGSQAGVSHVTEAQSVQADGPTKYYESWMLVRPQSLDGVHAVPGANWVDVTLYDDEDTPAGVNFPPCPLMKIARRGNAGSTEECRRRQGFFLLSSTIGDIIKYSYVTTPKLQNWNYGATFGSLPEFVRGFADVRERLAKWRELGFEEGDYVFATGIVVQDFIQISKQGKPIVDQRDRGDWTAFTQGGGVCLCEDWNEDWTFETTNVWNNGIKWRCLRNKTTQEPRWNCEDWNPVGGDMVYYCEILSSAGRTFRNGDVDTVLTMTVRYGLEQIEDRLVLMPAAVVTWSRDTGNASEDISWTATPATPGDHPHVIHLTRPDLGSGWMSQYRKVTIHCSVWVPGDNGVTTEYPADYETII